MSHREKRRHKPRHHTHPVKPANLSKPDIWKDAPEMSAPTPELLPTAEPQAVEREEDAAPQG